MHRIIALDISLGPALASVHPLSGVRVSLVGRRGRSSGRVVCQARDYSRCVQPPPRSLGIPAPNLGRGVAERARCPPVGLTNPYLTRGGSRVTARFAVKRSCEQGPIPTGQMLPFGPTDPTLGHLAWPRAKWNNLDQKRHHARRRDHLHLKFSDCRHTSDLPSFVNSRRNTFFTFHCNRACRECSPINVTL